MTKQNPQKIHLRNSPRISRSDFAYKSDQRDGLQMHPGGGVAAQARDPGPQPARTPPRALPGPARGPWRSPSPGSKSGDQIAQNRNEVTLLDLSQIQKINEPLNESIKIHKKRFRSGWFQHVPVECYSTLPRGRRESNKNIQKTQQNIEIIKTVTQR